MDGECWISFVQRVDGFRLIFYDIFGFRMSMSSEILKTLTRLSFKCIILTKFILLIWIAYL